MNKLVISSLAIMSLTLGLSASSHAEEGKTVKISITNVTKGQIMSPAVIASHNQYFSLFELGQPASSELAAVAEDAVNAPLVEMLNNNPDVYQVTTGNAPIPPGATRTYEIKVINDASYISLVGMLVTTNDTFYSVRTKAPLEKVITLTSPGYDAGSETNNESCAYIPGPPCGSPGVHTNNAEGYVYIGNGIHGIGDLSPTDFDWTNPVAVVKVSPAY